MAKSLAGIGLLEATLNFGKEVEAFHRFLDRCVGWGARSEDTASRCLANAQVHLRASQIKCERSELHWIARRVQRTL